MKEFKKIAKWVTLIFGLMSIGYVINEWISPNPTIIKEVEVFVYKDFKTDTVKEIRYVEKRIEVPVFRTDTIIKRIIEERRIEICKTDTIYFPINPRLLANFGSDTTIFNSVPEALSINKIFEILDKRDPKKEDELWKELARIGLTSLITFGATRIK